MTPPTSRHDRERALQCYDPAWLAMLGSIGTVERFATWRRGGRDWHYQWAVVRVGGSGAGSTVSSAR